jgi:hypothetical protein
VHYNFTSREVMSAAIEEGRFLEFAQVHTNLYGTRCVPWCWFGGARVSVRVCSFSRMRFGFGAVGRCGSVGVLGLTPRGCMGDSDFTQ